MKSTMKVLPFSETLAHPGHLLVHHLEQVAGGAHADLRAIGKPQALLAALAGLCHDLGKASFYFQKWRLEQRRTAAETRHSLVGGLIFWWLSEPFENLPQFPAFRLNGLAAILRHHGDLRHSRLEVLQLAGRELKKRPDLYHKILRSIDLAGMWSWLSKQWRSYNPDLSLHRSASPQPQKILDCLARYNALKLELKLKKQVQSKLEDQLEFMALFGALLAADKLDAAFGDNGPSRSQLPAGLVADYKNSPAFRRANSGSPLAGMRSRIAAKVLKTILACRDKHFFTFTAPTGSGKTLTVLDAALALRAEIDRDLQSTPRIIYCLPFTSVIDQTHQIVAAMLQNAGIAPGNDLLLKHHFLTEPRHVRYRQNDFLEEYGNTGQLLTETWQSEIVVTTFHQLLHTFFSGSNSNLKRAGQLANAIVILDEVQAVPLKYWEAIGRLFQAAAKVLGTRFILMTATQPSIFGPHTGAVELLEDNEHYFAGLARVNICCRHNRTVTPEDLADRVESDFNSGPTPTLMIVNRKKTVSRLYNILKNKLAGKGIKIFALSTNLTPRDRRKKIGTIMATLKRGEPVLVISTQLVEAGVDISFPVVHRDLAPLDCIIQSCGRCNRHSCLAGGGIIYLWQLAEDDNPSRPHWSGIYDRELIEVTREILPSRDETLLPEDKFLQLARLYFRACRQRRGQIRVDRSLAEQDFAELENQFRLIDRQRPTVAVFVIQDREDEQLWQDYRRLDQVESPLERRHSFLKFRFRFLERVIQVNTGHKPTEKEIIAIRASKGFYNPETGLTGLPEENGDGPCLMI